MALTTSDPAFLSAALEGLVMQKSRIEAQIAEVKRLLGHGKAAPVAAAQAEAPAKTKGGRRKMSAAARKRIADAQKKRWAEYRKAQQLG
jgi:hypothetical protein